MKLLSFKGALARSKFMTCPLEQTILASLPHPMPASNVCVWVAYSGGLDSTVLLHVLSRLNLTITVKALHVNHGLSANAHFWQQQCAQFAQKCGVSFYAKTVDVQPQGKGIEDAARQARYDVFSEVLAPSDLIVTGHHQNDQVETWLLRSLRGAGLKGLCAMPVSRQLDQGRLLRPLLSVSREVLEAYAKQHQLTFIEDESNSDTHFARNFLRHKVLPQLALRWPNYGKNIIRSIEHLTQSHALLEQYLEQDVKTCAPQKEKKGHSLCYLTLLDMSDIKRNNIIRHWLNGLGRLAPSSAHMVEINKLLHAKADAKPEVKIERYYIKRYKERIYCLSSMPKALSLNLQQVLTWQSDMPLHLPDGSELSLHPDAAFKKGLTFTVKFGMQSDRCKPVGKAHTQTLKKLYQQYNIPPWLRAQAPLIYYKDELIAVADFWLCSNTFFDVKKVPYGFNWRIV